MMSFCKKSVHSFLYYTNFMANGTVLESPTHLRDIPPPVGGLSYVTVFNDIRRPINVVESAGVKLPPSSPTTTTKRDSGRFGFLDDVRGSNGGNSCTESLGFESFDERAVDGEIENVNNGELGLKRSCNIKSRSEKVSKNFPPPLPSLDRNGRPKFVLRPVRKDGRLELKLLKIERPEVFRASRQDGRLILHVKDEDRDVEDHQTEYESASEHEEEEVVEEKARGERLFPTKNGGGDSFSRCHVAVSHHHNHPLSLQELMAQASNPRFGDQWSLRLVLILVGLILVGCIVVQSFLKDDSSAQASCSSCSCDCSSESTLSIHLGLFNISSSDCEEDDLDMNEEIVTNDNLQHKKELINKVDETSSHFQKEAEKCNAGVETCERAREKAEAELIEERKKYIMWKKRAYRHGWKDERRVYSLK